MGISCWINLKFGRYGPYNTKNFMKKKFSTKVIFLHREGPKSKKVVIFSKKREKREKAIFFFKNGQIDPKIGKIEVPQ